jgi:hypothetical protein
MDEVSKILTPKKKDQSADTNPPQKFSPYFSEKSQGSKDAETTLGSPFGKIHPWGGGGGH